MRRSWYSVLPDLDATISCHIKKMVVGVTPRNIPKSTDFNVTVEFFYGGCTDPTIRPPAGLALVCKRLFLLLISSDLISTECFSSKPSGTQWVRCQATQLAVAATNLNDVGRLIRRSYGKRGRFVQRSYCHLFQMIRQWSERSVMEHYTHAVLGWDGMGCAGNSMYFRGSVHTSSHQRSPSLPIPACVWMHH